MSNQLPLSWKPIHTALGWINLYVYHVDGTAGLPPSVRAGIICPVMKKLQSITRHPVLWVRVAMPGTWYTSELDSILKVARLPILVTGTAIEDPRMWLEHFAFTPSYSASKPNQPECLVRPFAEVLPNKHEMAMLRVLRALARMGVAPSVEIASMAGYGLTHTRTLMNDLDREGFVVWGTTSDKKQGAWQITRKGLRYVTQSWDLPGNVRYKGLIGEQKYAGRKHRRIARLCRAWISDGLGEAFEPWAAWTESLIGTSYPDAVVLGSYQGVETLLWVEVESGKKSRELTIEDIVRRFDRAKLYAADRNIQLIFVVLGQSWVLKSLLDQGLFEVPSRVALVFENWRNYGYISSPIFGGFNTYHRSFGFINVDAARKTPGGYQPRLLPNILNDIQWDAPTNL